MFLSPLVWLVVTKSVKKIQKHKKIYGDVGDGGETCEPSDIHPLEKKINKEQVIINIVDHWPSLKFKGDTNVRDTETKISTLMILEALHPLC